MRQIIPSSVIGAVARVISQRQTASGLENLFRYAGAPGEPPLGSKMVTAEGWLRFTNKDLTVDPLDVLGKIIEDVMEGLALPHEVESFAEDRELISTALRNSGLAYVQGGRIVGNLGMPSRSLEVLIRDEDLSSIDVEFERAMKTIEDSPRDSVSAASNILEITCKVIIEADGLTLPAKEDLQSVWNVIRKHLGIDASVIEDQDLQKIISGLCSVVGGIGALRTHASSAHGNAHKKYKLESRHARLAVHSAHTITMFIVESWIKKKRNPNG